jgi:hypothetical protein
VRTVLFLAHRALLGSRGGKWGLRFAPTVVVAATAPSACGRLLLVGRSLNGGSGVLSSRG